MAINILIVDDHTLFRQGLRRVLELEIDFAVVGEAMDGGEAVKIVKALSPDLILMDISMPNYNGIDAAREIKRMLPATSIIFLTMYEDAFIQQEVIKAGASGYVLKRSMYEELFDAIRKVQSGNTCFLPLEGKIADNLIMPSLNKDLSLREKEILSMLARGMANKEISLHLGITIRTVETHRKNIMKKLNLHCFSDIIKYALAHGLIQ